MLGLFLDSGALILIVMLVNEDDQVEFTRALCVSVAISILFSLVGLGLASLGTVGRLLGLVPLTALTGLIIWLTLGLTAQRAMIAGVIFLVYSIVKAFVFMWMFS